MKSLDEVIEFSERCILPYPGDCLNCEYFNDEDGSDCRCKILEESIKYLKEYRDSIHDLDEEHKVYMRILKEYDKDKQLLSWDELSAMEGNPIWVEFITTGGWKRKIWGIVDGIYEDAFGKTNLAVCIPHDYLHFDRRYQGKTWNVYNRGRKI